MRTGICEVLRMGVGPGGVWRSEALGKAPSQREDLRRHVASAAGKKSSLSLSLFLDVDNLEIEHELSCAATDDTREA